MGKQDLAAVQEQMRLRAQRRAARELRRHQDTIAEGARRREQVFLERIYAEIDRLKLDVPMKRRAG